MALHHHSTKLSEVEDIAWCLEILPAIPCCHTAPPIVVRERGVLSPPISIFREQKLYQNSVPQSESQPRPRIWPLDQTSSNSEPQSKTSDFPDRRRQS